MPKKPSDTQNKVSPPADQYADSPCAVNWTLPANLPSLYTGLDME